MLPKEKEAAGLGAAIIAAVGSGCYGSFREACAGCVEMTTRYEPHPTEELEKKYRRFCALYDASVAIARM